MQGSWLGLLDRVLRPARPDLERCLNERARHVALRCSRQAERTRALALCVEQIDEARRVVFEADDGVVGAHMTALEREWRRLSREDPEGGLMDLWAGLVTPASIDLKRWRGAGASDELEALVALAADEANVILAEAALAQFAERLSQHGVVIGKRIRWRFGAGQQRTLLETLVVLAKVAAEKCGERERAAILAGSEREQESVRAAGEERFLGRPLLVEELAQAAQVDFLWRSARLGDSQNPVSPLLSLWGAGYAIYELDAREVTLEIPPLDGE
jgi:hypothetical protein